MENCRKGISSILIDLKRKETETGGPDAIYRPEGGYTDMAIRYFTERAKGGFGLIIPGALAPDYVVDPYSIEVHAMHWGYLLDQFAMSYFNKRDDEYGGSLENRMRVAKLLVERIKEACGSNYPVSMRLAVNIPIICDGRMNDPDIACKAVEEGKMDAITLERPSLADPEYPNKLFSGHREKIRPCLGCNLGCFNRLLAEGKPTCCAVNPTAMRESEYELKELDIEVHLTHEIHTDE